MSDLYIDTDKGRLYITGDNAVEMIVPPGWKVCVDDVLPEGQRLPDLPPIEYDMSEEDAEELRRLITESVRRCMAILKEAGQS